MKFYFFLSFLFLAMPDTWGQDTIYAKGNAIVFSRPDSVSIMDPVTGAVINKIMPRRPMFLNGEQIYSTYELESPPVIEDAHGNKIKLSEYIFQSVRDKLALLEDGLYILDITNPIIDKHGRLVYYEMKGIKQIKKQIAPAAPPGEKILQSTDPKGMVYTTFLTDDGDIPLKIRDDVNNSVSKTLMDLPALQNARKSNLPVNTTGYLFSIAHHIVVEKNAAKLTDDFFSL